MDQENQVHMAALPKSEHQRPSKSILKANNAIDSKTMPLPSKQDKSDYKRRVSFAPEVTLHKIDFISYPPDERRKTMGSTPSEDSWNDNPWSVGGQEPLEDSSDDDTDSSFLNLEADADKIINGMNNIRRLEEEEVPMELTEQLPFREEANEQEMELTEPMGSIQSNPQENQEQTQEAPATHDSPQEFVDAVENALEEDMNLTGVIRKEPITEIEEATMDVTKVYRAGELESTMDITKVYLTAEQELTMNITQVYSSQSEPTQSQEAQEEREEPTLFPDHLDTITEESTQSQPEEESAMELTQPISTLSLMTPPPDVPEIPSEPVQTTTASTAEQTESQEMELTQPAPEASQEMVLTQPVEELSQPMQLTQPEDRKRPSEGENSVAKVPRVNGGNYETTTTTIPLADVSTHSIEEEDFVPVTLAEFFKDIGIRFYDDLEISTHPAKRVSLAVSERDHEWQDYYKANSKLPLLEVFELSCKELMVKIKQDRSQFESIKDTVLPENQELFKDYYMKDIPQQLALRSQFQLVKEYSRHEAKKIWYEWRIRLMENILTDINSNFETLETDKQILLENIAIIDTQYVAARERFSIVKAELTNTLEMQKKIKSLNLEQIREFKTRLLDINQRLTEYLQQIASKNQELTDLESLIAQQESEAAGVKDQIAQVESAIKDLKQYDTGEIEVLTVKFKVLQAMSGLHYIKHDDSSILFSFQGLLNIHVDFNSLENSSGIQYSLADNESPLPGVHNRTLLKQHILKLPYLTETTSVLQNFNNFKKSWQLFCQLDKDLYKISMKFPITIVPTDNTIVVKIRYYSSIYNVKAWFTVSINLSDLQQYPEKVRVEAEVVKSLNYEPKFIADTFIQDSFANNLVSNSDGIVFNV